MTSPLPPRLRDSRNLADLVRQQKQNGRQLDGGLLGGRWSPAKPLGATAQLGDLEDDGEDEVLLWEWGDRLIVTTAGRQTFRLSHEPIDESLVVRWHPDGKGSVDVLNAHFIVNGQTVTILDPEGDVQPGDMFSAQYQYEDVEVGDSALTLIGTDTVDASSPTLALPAGSEVGDFVVIVTTTGTIADGRVGLIADHDGTGLAHFYTYAGTLTSLADFVVSGGSTLATWAVFRAPALSVVPAPAVGPGSSAPGVVAGSARHAIFVGAARNGFVDASLFSPTGYTTAVTNALRSHARHVIAYWDATADETSPSDAPTGFFDDYMISVLGVTNVDD